MHLAPHAREKERPEGKEKLEVSSAPSGEQMKRECIERSVVASTKARQRCGAASKAHEASSDERKRFPNASGSSGMTNALSFTLALRFSGIANAW